MKRRLVGVCKVSAIVRRGGVSPPDWEILLAKSTVPAAPEMYAAAPARRYVYRKWHPQTH